MRSFVCKFFYFLFFLGVRILLRAINFVRCEMIYIFIKYFRFCSSSFRVFGFLVIILIYFYFFCILLLFFFFVCFVFLLIVSSIVGSLDCDVFFCVCRLNRFSLQIQSIHYQTCLFPFGMASILFFLFKLFVLER